MDNTGAKHTSKGQVPLTGAACLVVVVVWSSCIIFLLSVFCFTCMLQPSASYSFLSIKPGTAFFKWVLFVVTIYIYICIYPGHTKNTASIKSGLT